MVECNGEALKKKYKLFEFGNGICPACISDTVAQDVKNARAYKTANEVSNAYDVRNAMGKFATMCYSDIARKEVVYTVETFRKYSCLKMDANWRECIHLCAECKGHFKGEDVQVDHYDVEFRHILIAFLDRHVPGWLIPPDDGTFVDKQNRGSWKSNIREGSKQDFVETQPAYWQRVKNVSLRRWTEESLGQKFVMFHNSIVKLQVLCKDCHHFKTTKSASTQKLVAEVYDESIGSSAKRTADIEADDAQKQEEDEFFQSADIEGMLTRLHCSIKSMDAFTIQRALSTIPEEWMESLPLVKTAKQALDDIRAVDEGVIRFPLPPLRRDTKQRIREVTFTCKRARE